MSVVNIYIECLPKKPKGEFRYAYIMEWKKDGVTKGKLQESSLAEGTYNQVFLKVTTEVLERIKKPAEIHIYEPCAYVTNMVTKGLQAFWHMNDWIMGEKVEIKNRELWEPLLVLVKKWDPIFHAGDHKRSDELKEMICKEISYKKEDKDVPK